MLTIIAPVRHADQIFLSKRDLHTLADGIILKDRSSIDRCVDFVVSESKGLWHGRARAMMCRRLKHCDFGRKQRAVLVEVISGRLASGEFSEQFKDQLRLAMHLDMNATVAAAYRALKSSKGYVIRYAQWVLSHENL